jgi:hypothetical protein
MEKPEDESEGVAAGLAAWACRLSVGRRRKAKLQEKEQAQRRECVLMTNHLSVLLVATAYQARMMRADRCGLEYRIQCRLES